MGWACAEALRESAELRVVRLGEVQRQREKVALVAIEAHRESRVKTEQMQRVVERVRREEAIVDGRREQAGADDRYAARTAYEKTRPRAG